MPGSARLGRLTALAAASVVALPGAAGAHGGTVVASGANDAYRVTVQASDVRASSEPLVDVTVYPISRANGAPVSDATVTVRIDGGAPIRATPASGAFEVLVPAERYGAWREWSVVATVEGPAGRLTLRGAQQPSPGADAPGWLVPATAVGLVAAVALVVRRRRPGSQARGPAT